MSARVQAWLMLLFGAFLLQLGFTDTLLRYVRPTARPLVLIAGVLILGLAIWTIWSQHRAHDAQWDFEADLEHVVQDDEIDVHGHSAASRASWLVLAPIVAGLVVAPPALGEFSADRDRLVVTAESVPERAALPKSSEPVTLTMREFLERSVQDDGATLAGNRIRITGFVSTPGAGTFVLNRVVIRCCAADAQAVRVSVDTSAPIPPKGTWVTVVGRHDGFVDTDWPIVTAESVTPVKPPKNPYG